MLLFASLKPRALLGGVPFYSTFLVVVERFALIGHHLPCAFQISPVTVTVFGILIPSCLKKRFDPIVPT